MTPAPGFNPWGHAPTAADSLPIESITIPIDRFGKQLRWFYYNSLSVKGSRSPVENEILIVSRSIWNFLRIGCAPGLSGW
jgi:hypothetical protein